MNRINTFLATQSFPATGSMSEAISKNKSGAVLAEWTGHKRKFIKMIAAANTKTIANMIKCDANNQARESLLDEQKGPIRLHDVSVEVQRFPAQSGS